MYKILLGSLNDEALQKTDPILKEIIFSSKREFFLSRGAPVAQWVKRWPTDLADRVRSSLEVKSSQP